MADHKQLEALSQQEAVFQLALMIYEERSEMRGEVWAEFGPEDALHHCESKIARIGKALALGIDDNERRLEACLDDVVDLVNYAAFLHRHITGEKPKLES